MPGDILVGDLDGLVVISQRDAAELLALSKANLAGEQEELERMKNGHYMPSSF